VYDLQVTHVNEDHPKQALRRNFVEHFMHTTLMRKGVNGIVHNVHGKDGKEIALASLVNRCPIWTTQPITFVDPNKTVEDLFRSRTPLSAYACQHFSHECQCQIFEYAISMDTLYYIEPLEWAKTVRHTTENYALAAFHIGEQPECDLFVLENNRVKIQMHGNSQVYTHWSMQMYLEINHISYTDYTLCWQLLRQHEGMYVFAFMVVDSDLFPNPVTRNCYTYEDYYGRDPEPLAPVETGPTSEIPDDLVEAVAANYLWSPNTGKDVMKKQVSTARQYCNQRGIVSATTISQVHLAAITRSKELQTQSLQEIENQAATELTFVQKSKRNVKRLFNFLFCGCFYKKDTGFFGSTSTPDVNFREYFQGEAAIINERLNSQAQTAATVSTTNLGTLILSVFICLMVLSMLRLAYSDTQPPLTPFPTQDLLNYRGSLLEQTSFTQNISPVTAINSPRTNHKPGWARTKALLDNLYQNEQLESQCTLQASSSQIIHPKIQSLVQPTSSTQLCVDNSSSQLNLDRGLLCGHP
jgi:hypothetical protein